ncbi:MAG: CARDB domain-containing protein [Chitinophagales bacterium]
MKLSRLNLLILLFLCLGIWVTLADKAYAEKVITDVTATAGSYFGVYSPDRAVNTVPDSSKTDDSSRWYCTNTGDKWLQVDLKKVYYITKWNVAHLGSAGWDTSCNTRDFRLESSLNDTDWLIRDNVAGNSSNINTRDVSAFPARYVRLYITYGNQNNNLWASIMDFQVCASAPQVSSVNLPENETYAVGGNLDFTVNYTADVIVTGTPSIPIALDSGPVNAQYISGSGTQGLTFRYTIQSGDAAANGISLGNMISLNGGSIMDGVGNSANLEILNNNEDTSGILISTPPTYIDLAFASDVAVSSSSFCPNGKIKIAYNIVNQGTVATTANCLVSFYLVEDADQAPASGILLDRVVKLSKLKSTKGKKGSLSCSIPGDMKWKQGYVKAVIDADGSILEINKANNINVSAALTFQYPDMIFVPGSVNMTSTSSSSDTKVTVQDTVMNTGTASAGKFTVNYYLWDGTNPASKNLLASRKISQLKVYKVSAKKTKLTIPANLTPGTWYLWAEIDEDGAVYETENGETNNCFKLDASITIT